MSSNGLLSFVSRDVASFNVHVQVDRYLQAMTSTRYHWLTVDCGEGGKDFVIALEQLAF